MTETIITLLLVVGAFGAGSRLLGLIDKGSSDRLEAGCFSVALGFGALILIILMLGLSSLLYPQVVAAATILWFVTGVPVFYRALLEFISWLKTQPVFSSSVYFWVIVVAMLAMILNWVGALAPPHGATDPLAYHLALPKIFLREHALSFAPTVNGTLYPNNMGLLYAVAIALGNGTVAQTIHLTMAVLTCVAIVGFGRSFFCAKAGVWAASIFSFVPLVVGFGRQAYVDLGLCFFQFCALWAVLRWTRSRTHGALVLAAILTGLAMGVKHQGLVTLMMGAAVVGFVGIRTHGVRQGMVDLGVYTGLSCLLIAPWYARALYFASNPVWPLANGFFDGEPFRTAPRLLAGGPKQSTVGNYLSALFLPVEWLQSHWHSLSLWRWTFEPPSLQRAVGGYFLALLPGLVLCARDRRVMVLLGFCCVYYLILIRFLHMNPRYGIALLAFAAVLCGLVAEHLASHRIRVVGALFKVVFVASCVLNMTGSYLHASAFSDVVFGSQSRDDFLSTNESNYRLFQHINNNLPETATVLLQGIVKGYYCDREYLWDHPHQSVLSYDGQDAQSLFLNLQELEITHIARMINIPGSRQRLGYPQYFQDPLHEEFRKRFLKLEYHDRYYALFSLRKRGDA